MICDCISAVRFNGTIMVLFRPQIPAHPNEHITLELAAGDYKRGNVYRITIENITAMSP
jgi:hypothetical protein